MSNKMRKIILPAMRIYDYVKKAWVVFHPAMPMVGIMGLFFQKNCGIFSDIRHG